MSVSFSAAALLVLVFGIAIAPAEIFTEKQAQDAAARIDALIGANLKSANLKPNDRIEEGTFLRRAYLGIIGRIPTEKESRAFLDDPSSKKREALIDSLVASRGFDSHLFNWTADLLRVQTNQEEFGLGWHVWLRKSLAEDKPWDVVVREMLSATGHAAKNPAVGYFLRDRNMQLDNFSNTMQVFLGRQIGCAQCHDHPFDAWSQLEYYQMAAFGGGFEYRSNEAQEVLRGAVKELRTEEREDEKIRFKERKNKKEFAVHQKEEARKLYRSMLPVFRSFRNNALFDDPTSSLRLPEDYQYADGVPNEVIPPETLFGEEIKDVAPEQRREVFAKWVTSPDNPYFTKVIANRLWARTFGYGLLEPLDDWTEDSEPSHPEVLAFLETTMKEVDYDLRQFCRVLYLTDLFQQQCESSEPEPGVAHLFRGPALQRMSAEQLYDSMLVLSEGEIEDSPLNANAERWENYSASIDILLDTEAPDLLVLGEAAYLADLDFREAQRVVRELRETFSEVSSPKERQKLQLEIREAQKEAAKFNRLRDPAKMVATNMSMTDMSMSAGGMWGRGNGREKSTTRVSELPAPFKPGTLVREFGGSDRSTPSSGDTVPTVPQALALLNGRDTDILGGKRSNFASRLSSLETPEERLDFLFLSIYSRNPTSDEKESFLPLAEEKTTLRDLARAMLTSNQFIFIQ